MGSRKTIPATSVDVRDYFAANPKKIPTGAEKSVKRNCKGRIKVNAIDVFNADKSHGMHYEEGNVAVLPLTYKARNHRKVTVHLPVSEIRALAGKPGSRGPLGQRALEAAAEAYAASA